MYWVTPASTGLTLYAITDGANAMSNKKHDPEKVKAVIAALEHLRDEPSGVNLVQYSNLALPLLIGHHAKGFRIMPHREGVNTVAVVEGAEQALAYLRSLL